MDITKRLNAISIPEMVIISLTLLLLLNGFAYLIFTLFFNIPSDELFAKTLISLIFTPLILGVTLSFINMDGILTINSQEKTNMVLLKIEALLEQREYQVIKRDNGISIFEYKTKWKRLISFNNGKVIISNIRGIIEISGNRNVLFRIAAKLKYG